MLVSNITEVTALLHDLIIGYWINNLRPLMNQYFQLGWRGHKYRQFGMFLGAYQHYWYCLNQ